MKNIMVKYKKFISGVVKMKKSKIFLRGMKNGIPIGLGYLAVSFTLGIAAKKIGMTAFQSTLMSFTNNTSAGEFAALDLIKTSAPYIEMALVTLIINIRYMLMSCALSQKLSPDTSLWKRLLLGYCITDEVFGISIAYEGRLDTFYTYGAMLVATIGWSTGTFLGVEVGSILPASVMSALGVALYGMFIAIIVPPAKKNKVIALAVICSMAVSWGFTKIPVVQNISSGFRIVIITVVIAGILAVLFPVESEVQDEN